MYLIPTINFKFSLMLDEIPLLIGIQIKIGDPLGLGKKLSTMFYEVI